MKWKSETPECTENQIHSRLDDICYGVEKAQVVIGDARKSKNRDQMTSTTMSHAKKVFQYVSGYLQLITDCCFGDGSVYKLRAKEM